MQEILIVDDESVIREGLEVLFASSGYCTRTVSNGNAALTAIADKCPDVVLLDVMMPGMDGYTVCGRIRAKERDLPIVFLTAKDSDADQIRGLDLGADDYLSKTASPGLILARVRRTLARNRQFRNLAVPSDLTRTEASIYRLLKDGRGRLFSYREIFASICGEGYYADEGAIRSHVSRLRVKLASLGETIESRRGRGYRLVESGKAVATCP